MRIGAGVRAGFSALRSRGSLDYHAGGPAASNGGAYDLRLVGVHPYASRSAAPTVDVWGTVGHAWGQARIVDDVAGSPRTSAACRCSQDGSGRAARPVREPDPAVGRAFGSTPLGRCQQRRRS